jgi:hypothetical protein
MKNILLLITLLTFFSSSVFAGFCDNRGVAQKVKDIHVFGGFAYIKIEPGLDASADATNATLSNIAALELNEYGQKNIMPLLLTALAADKSIQLSYCKGIVGHGYIGAGNTVVLLSSIKLIK